MRTGRPPRPADERFWAKVDKSGECWLWTARVANNGYGHFTFTYGPTVLAHRQSYEWLKGPIGHGLQIDHLCRVRHCVNPEHLEAVTPSINTLRGNAPAAMNAQKTHCPAGHPYDLFNTGVSNGLRHCRTCKREKASRKRLAGEEIK